MHATMFSDVMSMNWVAVERAVEGYLGVLRGVEGGEGVEGG